MNRNDRQRAAPPSSTGTPQQPAPATRNNEYFLPRDGIDREVITADICRYLGNDALVRPGHLEVSLSKIPSIVFFSCSFSPPNLD